MACRTLRTRRRPGLERLEDRLLPSVVVNIDASLQRRAINPHIYGVAYADRTALADLNATLNRQGGNPTSRYNWRINADNRGEDYFFESIGYPSSTPGEHGDSFIA